MKLLLLLLLLLLLASSPELACSPIAIAGSSLLTLPPSPSSFLLYWHSNSRPGPKKSSPSGNEFFCPLTPALCFLTSLLSPMTPTTVPHSFLSLPSYFSLLLHNHLLLHSHQPILSNTLPSSPSKIYSTFFTSFLSYTITPFLILKQ